MEFTMFFQKIQPIEPEDAEKIWSYSIIRQNISNFL